RLRIAHFIAQEVTKDGKIPHFSREAVEEIILEARRMANRKNHLTLRLRELGGLVRAAGDIALSENAKKVTLDHVISAKGIARNLEQQIADRFIERKKEYEVIVSKGNIVGRVNGLAVIGDGGLVLPIEAQVTPGGKNTEFIATGKLGDIAKEAVTNVSAIIKKLFGDDLKEKFDVYVQFLQTYEGVEGDSASIAIAVAVISALKKIPIKQNYCMTGSLTVRGEVLPIGGINSKIEGAIDTGMEYVLVPKSNIDDIVLDKKTLSKIKVISVENIAEVLENALDWTNNKTILNKIKKAE
ncbi:MAG: S16 family serine protease, partial [Nanoarchaeota archaeon]